MFPTSPSRNQVHHLHSVDAGDGDHLPVAIMATAQGCLLVRQHGAFPGLKGYEGTQFRLESDPSLCSKLGMGRRDVQGTSCKHVCISNHGIRIGGCGSDGIMGDVDAKKWRLQLCNLRHGIGFGSRGLRYWPWRSAGASRQAVVRSSEADVDANIDLPGMILSLRTALIEGAISSAFAICGKWVLAVAIAVSINFLPWATDIAAAQRVEASECDNVSQYYNQASGLKGEELKAKLHELVAGHKRLSYAEVWNALKILDAADTETPDTSPDIVDVYSLKRVPKSLQGKGEGWNREHLWPRSYGLEEGRPEFTDVHNLRPADVNVNSSRGNKYFGDCTARMTPRCLIPANREAAADTATDANTWRPPSQVRGDIARAVFYMTVRYGIEQPSGSLNLQLSDSPRVANATMGLLSTLLQWNNLDPPSPSEVLRNSRVCSLYQGNRNPFVDHPEYASSIWGAPDVVTGPTTPAELSSGSGPEKENQLPQACTLHQKTQRTRPRRVHSGGVVGRKTDIS